MEGTGEGGHGQGSRILWGLVGSGWEVAGLEVYEVRFMGSGSARNGSWGTIMMSTAMI